MNIYNLSEQEIEKLSPEEFRTLIMGEEVGDGEDDEDCDNDCEIEETDGELIDYLGKKVILLASSEIDGGYDLPTLQYTYNLRKVQTLSSTGSYWVDIYEKVDPLKTAYAYYDSHDWKDLVKV